MRDQAPLLKVSRAFLTARSTSPAWPRATSAIVRPVAGLVLVEPAAVERVDEVAVDEVPAFRLERVGARLPVRRVEGVRRVEAHGVSLFNVVEVASRVRFRHPSGVLRHAVLRTAAQHEVDIKSLKTLQLHPEQVALPAVSKDR
ncbi:MAG: hypothetical protein U5L06_16355 [Rhodovibrio sp.]|nr:hypothetical protein [Rhodovibrio sp.]